MRLLYLKRLADRLSHVDVVHLFQPLGVSSLWFTLPVVLLSSFFGKRVVLEYPDPIELSRAGGRSLLLPRMWRLCHAVVVPSPYQEQVVNMFGGRGHYVRPCSDIGKIEARVVAKVQPRVVVVAPLERESNIPTIIRACKLAKQKYPRTELVVAGDGRLGPALRRLAESELRGGVEFVEHLDLSGRRELFKECDIFVNNSSIDYLSAAMVEALAAGLPVLSSPVAAGTGLFRDRENVIDLRFGGHVTLADRIIELIEDARLTEKLSRSGPDTAHRICVDQIPEVRVQMYAPRS